MDQATRYDKVRIEHIGELAMTARDEAGALLANAVRQGSGEWFVWVVGAWSGYVPSRENAIAEFEALAR